MLVVVSAEEGLAKSTGVFDGAEAIPEFGAVFHSADCRRHADVVAAEIERCEMWMTSTSND